MKTLLVASALAVAITAVGTGSAFACPNGYKKVWIQGNPVCQLDASASNKLKANTKPTLHGDIGLKKRQVRMNTKSR
ncbi:MAG: hypothetical protein ACLFPA_05200 [Dichotomicrobium sp.]